MGIEEIERVYLLCDAEASPEQTYQEYFPKLQYKFPDVVDGEQPTFSNNSNA